MTSPTSPALPTSASSAPPAPADRSTDPSIDDWSARDRRAWLSTSHDRTIPASAPVPRRPPAIGWVGVLLALAVTVVGVLAIVDGAVRAGWVGDAEPVLTPLLTGPAVVTPQPGAAVVGSLLALLGLAVVWLAVKPGERAGVRLGGTAGIWMSRPDLERLVSATAERCDGVLSAHTRATRRHIRVDLETTTPDVQDAAAGAVRDRLAGLTAPRITVRTAPRFERRAR